MFQRQLLVPFPSETGAKLGALVPLPLSIHGPPWGRACDHRAGGVSAWTRGCPPSQEAWCWGVLRVPASALPVGTALTLVSSLPLPAVGPLAPSWVL